MDKNKNKLDVGFDVPDFGLGSVTSEEEDKIDPYDIIKEYDKKVEELTKELVLVRFERDRLKAAFSLLTVYIKQINFEIK